MSANKSHTLRGIRPLLLATATCALLLHIIVQLLTVRTGYGVEDYLGWVNSDAVEAMHHEWRHYGVSFLAVTYAVFDTVAFMPLYGALLFALADKFLLAVAKDRSPENATEIKVSLPRKYWLSSVFYGLLIFLLAVDLVENFSGLVRTSALVGWGSWLGVLLSGCGLLGVLLAVRKYCYEWWNEFVTFTKDLDRKQIYWVLLATAGFSAIGLCTQKQLWSTPLVWAHHIKFSLIVGDGFHFGIATIYLVLLTGLILAWFFGFCFDAQKAQSEQDNQNDTEKPVTKAYEARSKFRHAFGDMLVRSRYVFFALIVFTGLALVMNQGRDVLYSVADQPSAWRSLAVFGISSIAMWSFGFACWLWTRSVCLMQSPATPSIEKCHPVTLEDRLAKDWARLLGLMPALLFVLLCAATMRDALWAEKTGAVWFIGSFTVAALVGGFSFIWLHIRDEEPHFFNYMTFDAWHEAAQKNGSPAGQGVKKIFQTAIAARYKLFGVITPFWLPFYAITAMFLCRLLPSSDIWPPMAIAIFCFH